MGYYDYTDAGLQPPELSLEAVIECKCCELVYQDDELDDKYLCIQCREEPEKPKGGPMKTIPTGVYLEDSKAVPAWFIKLTWFIIGVSSVLFLNAWL